MLQLVFSLVYLLSLVLPFPPRILSHQDKKAESEVLETFDRNYEVDNSVLELANGEAGRVYFWNRKTCVMIHARSGSTGG